MRTVLQKRNQPQKQRSSSRAQANKATSGPNPPLPSILRLQRTLGNQAVQRLQAKLSVSSPGDLYEQEADRVADQVMRIPEGEAAGLSGASGGKKLQRKCARCAAGGPPCAKCQAKKPPVVQRRAGPGSEEGEIAVPDDFVSRLGPGRPLDFESRAFMEPRFGHDFGQVRIHTDAQAAQAARSVQARAFTVGRDVVFGSGEYSPGTEAGQKLLAHELTHVVQQDGSGSGARIQRRVYEGHDHGGRYEIDDEACRLTYRQNWFFTFRADQNEEERAAYMEAVRAQIQEVWSDKFPLIPDLDRCPCHPDGITVGIVVHTHERDRGESRGFTVIVTPTEARGFTNQPIRQIDLGTAHDVPVRTRVPGGQRRIAHEFGHTIGLTDEYHGWAGLFNTEGSRDRPSIMHSGDEVRPRHYQHFADLVNLELGGGCSYFSNGIRFPEYENPVGRFTGVPFPFLSASTESLIGLQFDRRISNEAVLGLMYPTAGIMTLYDPSTRSFEAGPTVGLRLNQLAHPLFVDVRTGLLFDLDRPESALDLRLPLSIGLGIRRPGFEAGVGYTAIADLLGGGGWTHLVGVGLNVELPGPLR